MRRLPARLGAAALVVAVGLVVAPASGAPAAEEATAVAQVEPTDA